MPKQFKNWTVPGPEVPGLPNPLVPGETLDALSGNFKIYQYEKGHRFSTDDILVAWYGTTACPRADRILDLGSGIGSVGLIAAWRSPGARLVSIEAQEVSYRLALRSIAYNGVANRWDARLGDFREPGIFSEGEVFDLILTSPPYFPEGTGIEPEHPQKRACRFELRGDFSDYLRSAGPRLAPGGVVAGVFPWAGRERFFGGLSGLICLKYRPVILREGEEPLLFLYLVMNPADLPPELVSASPWREPELLIRRSNGRVSDEYMRIKLSIGFPP